MSVVLLLQNSPKQIERARRKKGEGKKNKNEGVVYLVASLSLSDQNEGI